MSLRIVPIENTSVGGKRFAPPFNLESKCPWCDETAIWESGYSYLSYPEVNVPINVYFIDGEDHEWEETIVLRVLAETYPRGGVDP